ncbi:MAG: hypothetical protein A3G39_08845 [Deltaproteobacteria bacterium RIFCSPLOWO2_12_FULL_43_16]|nr:MAG: hypothetical protein A3A85_03025 [Deltaproteobacteria bacterium RIFCSPLOWO2_01_FULL_42_9]OGQ61343.1 MAG: hypothetical protein A3G39_08845 [Deltaproteobacteria bacterium RIFCSPLOWO2_12_FULL_43_16]
MRQIRIVTLVFLFPLLISLSACGKSPEQARKELGQMNIAYTKENFLRFALDGDNVVVDLFLKAGMNPNSKKDGRGPLSGFTALHFSAMKGHVSTVRTLLDGGANKNSENLERWTPLHKAVYHNQIEVVKLLIAKRADINAQTMDGQTAANLAEEFGYTDIVKLLKDAGANE